VAGFNYNFGQCPLPKNIGVFDMNDDMKGAFGYGMVFGALFGAVPCLFLGAWLGQMELQRVAIEAKVAEYDSQTGVFQYKKVEEDGKK
jgi:hypothetical protein